MDATASKFYQSMNRHDAVRGLCKSTLPTEIVARIASMVSASTAHDISVHERRWCNVMRQVCEHVGELVVCNDCDEFVECDALCGGCRFFFDDGHCTECCARRRENFWRW